MEKHICPKFKQCPIFQNNVLFNEQTGKTYKNLYCLAGPDQYMSCKRFIVSEKTGKQIPQDIFPNCQLKTNDIIKRVESNQ